MSDLTCEQLRDVAAELALDLLSGRDRALALAHVNRCDACREHVRSLTGVGDRLLDLAPGVEPPVGFEDRVLARMGMTPLPRRRRHAAAGSRWLPLAVAAAAVALVFGLGGWAVGSLATQSTAVASAHPLRMASLHTSDAKDVGQVFTYQGDPSWMYMTVNVGSGVRDVSCELARRDGGYLPMGTFPLSGGHGGWGGELPVDPALITGARVLSTSGAVLATATFEGPYPSGSGH
jgi:hypothetical protein